MQNFDRARLRAHRQQEAEAGFPLLRGCPSTATIGLVLFLDGLDPAARLGFADQLSDFDEAQRTEPPATAAETAAVIGGLPLVERFYGARLGLATAVPRRIDLRLMPVRVLAGLIADTASGGLAGFLATAPLDDDPAARAPSTAHVATLDEAVAVAPTRLRRLIDEALAARYGATGAKIDADNTRFTATLPDGALTVDVGVRRGTIRHQLDYSVGARLTSRQPMWMASYEAVWRLPATWDVIIEANAERAAAHLVRLVDACLALA